MHARATPVLAALMLLCPASEGRAAATGRNWQVSVVRLSCEAAGSLVTLDARIRYIGPAAVVEAPVSQLVDGGGKAYPPRSLVWKDGQPLASWISAGGLRQLETGYAGEVQFRFEARESAGELKFEFGDVRALPLMRGETKGGEAKGGGATAAAGKGVCDSLLKPAQIPALRRPAPVRVADGKSGARVYRGAYPCVPAAGGAARSIEAQYPPYLPEQLLVFGRGYLPNLRQVELPMGRAVAQSYAYAGLDEPKAQEEAARRKAAADFPVLAGGGRHFAFSWGAQKPPSGNEIFSIGLYALRPCP